MKKFTLIELVVAITTLGILLSIILLNFFDIKKKAITSTMSQNIAIVQGEVDSYFIRKDSYPIKNSASLNLENPQLVDIEMLVNNGFQKQKLDTSKIKEQYYWVDVFGRVWGSTKNDDESINLIAKEEGSYTLDWKIKEHYSGYNVYEVLGYGYKAENTKYSNLEASNSKNSKFYKVVSENTVELNKPAYAQYEISNPNSTYLVSMVDEYGLESAPRGKFSGGTGFDPIIRGEGEYEFEITGRDMMYWVDFKTVEDKPGKSTIDYLFTVKDENGNYKEWIGDYFSLDPSTGIKVKVTMKGDDEGNKPSLYDLKIVFKYSDDPTPLLVPEEIERENPTEFTCPKFHYHSTFGIYPSNLVKGEKGNMVYPFYVTSLETFEDVMIPEIRFANYVKYKVLSKKFYISEDNISYVEYKDQESTNKCMVVDYEIEILNSSSSSVGEPDYCPEVTYRSSYDSTARTLQMVYSVYLEENQRLTKIDKPSVANGWVLKSIEVKYSHNKEEYKSASSIADIPNGSCVKLLFNYIGSHNFPPEPPIVESCVGLDCVVEKCGTDCATVCENCVVVEEESWCDLNPDKCKPECLYYNGSCEKPVCTTDCLTGPSEDPNPSDKELADPEWVTVDKLRFFGHGALGQLTRWYKEEHSDSIKTEVNSDNISLEGDTRIVYRYSKGNGSYWSPEYDNFADTGISTSVRATAYVQVRVSAFETFPKEDYPTVTHMRFYNEQGFLDMSMVQPTLTIIAEKNNNGTRNVYSNESIIKWSYSAADPRGKAIVDIEWDGDKRDKYPVGTYEIKARVKNDVEIWSEWVTLKLVVLEEKPVAVIKYKSTGGNGLTTVKDKFSWSLAESYDPDGDTLTAYDWINKKDYYPAGKHVVGLRVQDSEGYWSELVEETITVSEQEDSVARIESEDSRLVSNSHHSKINDANSSGGQYVHVRTSYSQYSNLSLSFEGTGIDIKFLLAEDYVILLNEKVLDRVTFDSPTIYHIRGLERGVHSIRISKDLSVEQAVAIDYFDIYDSEGIVEILSSKQEILDQNDRKIQDGSNLNKGLNYKARNYYQTNYNGKVKHSIIDSKGTVILTKNETFKGGTQGFLHFDWDGTDSKGDFVPTDVYTHKMEFVGIKGKSSVHNFKYHFVNETPSHRVEAEDPNLVTRPSVNTTSNVDYSGGMALHANTNYPQYSTITINFKGTGIDTHFIQTSKYAIYLDGVLLDIVAYKEPTTYSVRDLEDKDHTLRLALADGGKQSIILDYFDVYNISEPTKVVAASQEIVNSNMSLIQKGNILNTGLNEGYLVRTNYQLNIDATNTHSIKNASGKVVYTKTETVGGGSKGYHAFLWDGKDNSGNFVPSGNYTHELQFVSTNGVKSSTSFNYIISAEKADFRIEAEDNNLVTRPSVRDTSDPSYSGGKAISANTNYSQYSKVTVKFTGTGADIGFISTSSYNISLDGVVLERVSYGNKSTYSIRGLENKEHTLVLSLPDGNKQSIIVDYFDIYTK